MTLCGRNIDYNREVYLLFVFCESLLFVGGTQYETDSASGSRSFAEAIPSIGVTCESNCDERQAR